MRENNVTPKHIVLFPDGNRRWAKEQGLPTLEGHSKGRENFTSFMKWSKDRGVEIITVFGFSTENWNRSEEEVAYLMNLFEVHLGSEEQISKYMEEGVRVHIIGDRSRLSKSLLGRTSERQVGKRYNMHRSMNIRFGSIFSTCI